MESPSEGLAPLAGYRVLDLGVLVAGPLVGAILGDFGAEVIKVERPGAPDPMRTLYQKDGIGLFSKVEDRNKLPITLDLKSERGKELLARLVEESDVLVENYRPGVLEALGFSEERLLELNPQLIICRVSGWGQTGPNSSRRAFGRIGEAFGGFANLNGEPDGQPMHTAMSLGDTLGSVWAAIGVLLALLARERDGSGQVVDVGLYEAVLRQIEQQIVVFDQLGVDLTRVGNRNPGVPTVNLYETGDGKWFSVASATPKTIAALLRAVGLDGDDQFGSAEAVSADPIGFHEVLGRWMKERAGDEVEAIFVDAGAVGTVVRSPAELIDHPHVLAREMVISVDDPDLGQVRMQGVVPKLTRTPGAVRWAGRATGDANDYVFGELLGLRDDEIAELATTSVI